MSHPKERERERERERGREHMVKSSVLFLFAKTYTQSISKAWIAWFSFFFKSRYFMYVYFFLFPSFCRIQIYKFTVLGTTTDNYFFHFFSSEFGDEIWIFFGYFSCISFDSHSWVRFDFVVVVWFSLEMFVFYNKPSQFYTSSFVIFL